MLKRQKVVHYPEKTGRPTEKILWKKENVPCVRFMVRAKKEKEKRVITRTKTVVKHLKIGTFEFNTHQQLTKTRNKLMWMQLQ